MITRPWVSVEDAAKHLGLVWGSVYLWIDRRGLPAQKVGRLWKSELSKVGGYGWAVPTGWIDTNWGETR